jgi:hypothetical protein
LLVGVGVDGGIRVGVTLMTGGLVAFGCGVGASGVAVAADARVGIDEGASVLVEVAADDDAIAISEGVGVVPCPGGAVASGIRVGPGLNASQAVNASRLNRAKHNSEDSLAARWPSCVKSSLRTI